VGSSSKPSAGSHGTARNNIRKLHNIEHCDRPPSTGTHFSTYVKIYVLNSNGQHLKVLFVLQDGTHCTFVTKTNKCLHVYTLIVL
jgi:hypothetical protein